MKLAFSTNSILLLICLGTFSGCASSRNPLGWMSGSKSGANQAQMQALMNSNEVSAQKYQTGNNSSIYPPSIVQTEPLPKSEEDLKNPLQLHLTYAKLQEQFGALTEARSSYQKVIDKDPKSVEAILGLARLDGLAGRHPEAEKRFQKAIEIAPNSASAYFAYGSYLAEQKRHREAIEKYQTALRMQPKNNEFRYALGIQQAKLKQYDASVATLSEAVDKAEALYNVGYIAMQEHKNDAVAERYLAEALKLNPKLKQARYWIAKIRDESPRQKIRTASSETLISPEPKRQREVVNAIASQSAQHSEKKELMPASVPPGHHPESLTPEQWEQWKNQIR